MRPPRRIAVIGGGFSGAAFALHLLRDFPELAVDIVVIEPRQRLGAGLAYDSSNGQHRINVAAARMAVLAEDPEHFDRWFRAQDGLAEDPAALAPGIGLFPRRAAFARYVGAMLHEAAAVASGSLRHVRARACAVRRRGAGYLVELDDASAVEADAVVLAHGHPPAEPPAALGGLAGDPGLIADPWGPLAVAPDASVLIVGTGLTMTDVVASLHAGGHRGAIVALSRRGLLPRPRTPVKVEPRGQFAAAPSRSAVALLRRVRADIAAGNAIGRPWEDVIDAVRAQGREVWGALPPRERRRLLRHLQPYWDVHRYQCAPQIDAIIRQEQAGGRLRVLAASLQDAARRPDGRIGVSAHPRGAPAGERLHLICDVVITCTGPAHRQAFACNPLLRQMADDGLIEADGYGLGIAVDAQGRAVAAPGQPAGPLFVVGPPARGTWGELMGLPQVSAQPREVAGRLAALLAQPIPTPQEADA